MKEKREQNIRSYSNTARTLSLHFAAVADPIIAVNMLTLPHNDAGDVFTVVRFSKSHRLWYRGLQIPGDTTWNLWSEVYDSVCFAHPRS